MLPRGFRHSDPFEISALREDLDVREAGRFHDLGIGFALNENRQLLRDECLGRFVPMIRVGVRHDDGVDAENFLHRYGQCHCRIGQMPVDRARKAGV